MARLKWFETLSLFLILYCTSPRPVYAYLDPGTGSYLLQITLAVLFGGLYVLKVFWGRVSGVLKSLIRRKKESSESG